MSSPSWLEDVRLRITGVLYILSVFLPSARAHDFIQNIRVRVNSDIVIHPPAVVDATLARFRNNPKARSERRARHFATLDSEVRVLSRPSRGRASRFFSLRPPAVVSAAITPRTDRSSRGRRRPDDVRKDARRRPRARSLVMSCHPSAFATAFATGSRARRRREMFRSSIRDVASFVRAGERRVDAQTGRRVRLITVGGRRCRDLVSSLGAPGVRAGGMEYFHLLRLGRRLGRSVASVGLSCVSIGLTVHDPSRKVHALFKDVCVCVCSRD